MGKNNHKVVLVLHLFSIVLPGTRKLLYPLLRAISHLNYPIRFNIP